MAEIPKQDLLLKMLNMTTSDNDGQALVALRKANALLESAGWSWEKLLLGKIVVVEDPFAKIDTPHKRGGASYTPTTPPPMPRPTPPSNPLRPKTYAPPPQPVRATCLGTKKNIYPGFCYTCGDHVPAEKGFVFKPSEHNSRAQDKFLITCFPCNPNTIIASYPAPKNNGAWTATPSAPKLDSL